MVVYANVSKLHIRKVNNSVIHFSTPFNFPPKKAYRAVII